MRRAETMIEVKIHLHCFSVSPACLCLGCMNMGCVWCVCVCEREKKKQIGQSDLGILHSSSSFSSHVPIAFFLLGFTLVL